ncbi:MAG: hypothetical protein JST54_28405 [Deltaproteobacteria bacterium]|nr:hypothetical protein [Deltaproteobacteria bacterium]
MVVLHGLVPGTGWECSGRQDVLVMSLGLISAVAAAAPPVVVVESKVEQFRVAAKAAESHLSNAVEVEPSAPDLEAKLQGAPVVVAVGRRALTAAREHAGNATIVFCMVLGVTQNDLSGTITGVPLEADPSAALTDLREVLPQAHKVGVVYDPAASALWVDRARKAADNAGLQLVLKAVLGGAQARDAVEGMASGLDALWLPPDPKLYSRELSAYLLGMASERRLPLVGFLESFTQAGALASVSPNYADTGDRAGKLAAELLAKPAEKRVPAPPPVYAPGDLSLNLNTARALGVEVPPEAVARAGTHVFR